MVIETDKYKISVIIEKKNIKNLYMRVKDDLCLHVSVNKYVNNKEIINVINNNIKTIVKMYEKALSKTSNNSYIYYLGDKYNIEYIDTKKVYFNNDIIYTKDKESIDKYMKNQCKVVFNERVNRLLTMFDNIPKFELKIRSMKTRWGVCNRKSMTITLNSELIKKDVSLIDYVIIHEICHFKHFNHSQEFWKCVSNYYPYYKNARKLLKD